MKEALKLALEAMERSVATCFDQYAHQQVMSQPDHFINQAITALRLAIDVQNMASESTYKAALAQPAQEPLCPDCKAKVLYECVACSKNNYPQQRPWVGLTRMELIKCGVLPFGMSYELCQAIEAKLKEKNT